VPVTAETGTAAATKTRGALASTAIICILLAVNIRAGRVLAAVVGSGRARSAFVDILAVECAHDVFASTHLEVAIMGAVRTLVDVAARGARARVAGVAFACIARGLVGTGGVRIARGRWGQTLVSIYASSVLVLVAGFTVTRERASSICAILCGAITGIGTLRALVEVGARCTRARVARIACTRITRGLVGTSRVRIAHGR
jgi:hypothetical protein